MSLFQCRHVLQTCLKVSSDAPILCVTTVASSFIQILTKKLIGMQTGPFN